MDMKIIAFLQTKCLLILLCILELMTAAKKSLPYFRSPGKSGLVSDSDASFENVEEKGIYRGSYMSAHVLLNLLNKLGKRDKMRGLPSILSLFRNKFNEFSNTSP